MTRLWLILRTCGRWLGTVLGLERSRDRRAWLKFIALLLVMAAALVYVCWYEPYQGAERMRELFAARADQKAQGLSTVFFNGLDQAAQTKYLGTAKSWDFPGLESMPGGGGEYFVLRWLGVLNIEEAGRYGIGALVDDGLIILIDGKPLVHEWTQSASHEVWGTLSLSKGPHALDIRYLQLRGKAVLKMQWQRPGKNREPLPLSAMNPLKDPLPLGDIARLRLSHNMMKLDPPTYKPFVGGRFWRLPW